MGSLTSASSMPSPRPRSCGRSPGSSSARTPRIPRSRCAPGREWKWRRTGACSSTRTGSRSDPCPRSSRSGPARSPWWSVRTPRPYGEPMTTGLLLIHAFPLDARLWEPQLGSLGARLPLVAPHLPGFGATEGPDVLTMRAAADRCVGALDEAGVDTAVVCGLSMGGYVAFELWRTARQRVAALVLANTKAEADQ